MVSDRDMPLCLTIERPWLNNEPFVSCIPAGKYQFKAYNSPKFPHVWEILNVEGRDKILIHAGNSKEDVVGCIAVGNVFFAKGVLKSQDALDGLRKMLAAEGEIEIINRFEGDKS